MSVPYGRIMGLIRKGLKVWGEIGMLGDPARADSHIYIAVTCEQKRGTPSDW